MNSREPSKRGRKFSCRLISHSKPTLLTLSFILTFSLPSLLELFKLLDITSRSHCVSRWFSFSWQMFFHQRFSVFRIKQCTRKQPWNWDATFLLIRLQRCSGSKTRHLSKWHRSPWESRSLAKAGSFFQVSIRWIIMLASCRYVHLHMLIKLVFTRVKLLTGKGQVMPRLSWMFWVRANSRKVKWIFALKIIQTLLLTPRFVNAAYWRISIY